MCFSGARHMRRIITTSHKLNTRHYSILTTSTDTATPLKILQETNLHRIEAVEAINVIKLAGNLVKRAIIRSGNAARQGSICGGDEIVISGISGRFPQSDNLEEFKENLMNGVDMVCKQNRFKVGNKVPPCYGLMKNLEKFDAQFFCVPPKMAQVMDPALRKLFEVTFEAMVDGGVNPETLRGSKTGVFVGTTGGEGMDYWWLKGGTNNVRGYYFLGNLGLMQANHLSYTFDLQGPSMVINTGCSASLVALETAVDALRAGKCNSAIVASTSTQLNPLHSYEMKFLNALSPIGKCKSFSKEGDGFARGEAVVALLVQRKKDAKRNYALIRHVKSNSDGFKKEGVFFPSGISQERLLKQMYEEAAVEPGQVSYIEAHGTGTPAGDPQELEALANVFCKKGRTKPLLVGSVKSNMGHGESAAGLCGIAKILIAAQTGFIPPNLHFTQPSDNVSHLFGPRGLKVVSEPTSWKGGTVGVSAFGFGGTNAHAILELPQFPQGMSIESPAQALCENNLVTQAQNPNLQPYPVILPFSGRSEVQVKESLEKAIKFGEDVNFASLIHNLFQNKVTGHGYRGFGICGISPDTSLVTVSKCDVSSSQGPPLWFIFPGMGSQWNEMGKDLLKIDVFRDSFGKAKITLKNAGVDLEAILQENNSRIFENIRESVVAITAVQVALHDTILSLTRPPDGYIGHSFGELLCAYADGCLSAEETLLVADARGRAFEEVQKSQKSPGGMASVGLTWPQIQSRCPSHISPACHNSSNNVTVSGPLDEIQKFVKELQSEGIFAKEIHSCHFAAHSKYVEPAVENYTKYLNEIYTRSSNRDRTRSSKWISTAFLQSDWNEPLAQSATPAYHVHNMTSPVLFHEAVQHIPSNAVVVEIAPQGLFQTILRGSLSKQCELIAPMSKKADNKLNHFLMSIGEIYNAGVEVNFSRLYPAPNFPISGQTPGISSLIRWEHTQDWIVPITNNPAKHMEGILNIDLNDNRQSFLEGHKLDNRCVFPATGYLVFAWETLAASLGLEQNELPVIFEDINFERATFLSYNNPTQLRCSIFPGSGLFEIHQGGMTVVRGKITTPDSFPLDSSDTAADFKNFYQNTTPRNISNCLSPDDIYKEIQLKGYSYTGSFRGIQRADIGGNWAEIGWDGNWITFLDCALQSSLVAIKSRNTVLPIRLLSVAINPKEFLKFLDSKPPVQVAQQPANGATAVIPIQTLNNPRNVTDNSGNNWNSNYCEIENITVPVPRVPCVMQKEIGALHCPGVEIRGVTAALVPRKKQHGILSVNEYKFRPYYDTDLALEGNALNLTPNSKTASLAELIGIVCENSLKRKLNIFDIFTRSQNSVSDVVRRILSSQPMYEAYLNIMSTREELSKLDKEILGFGTVIEKPSRQDFFAFDGKVPHGGLESADLLFIDDVSALPDVVPLMKTDAWIVFQTPSQDNCGSSVAPILFPSEFLPVARKFSESNGGGGDSFLLKLRGKRAKIVKGISINSQNFEWLENLKSELSTELSSDSTATGSIHDSRLFVCSQNNPTDGIIGLVKCLRLEPGGDKIRCIFDPEGKLNLDFEKPDNVLSEIIDKDLVMNVFKNGSHGSYRHLPLTLNQSEAFVCPSKAVEHARVTMLTLGDLSSFRWVESPLTACETVDYVAMQTQYQYLDQYSARNSAGAGAGAGAPVGKHGNARELYSVHYSSMNFFNVMLASGKLPIHSKKDVSVEDILLGFEFAGLDSRGNRMMGVVASNTLASSVLVGNESLMWRVPDSWTLEEASTVPVVYATAYYALFYRAQMRRGQSILIHSGSGGTGQAAIRVALDMNCEVFTTVGSEEKRSYIKQLFPQLKDSNIGNSRDCSFEKMILRQTSGRGVDIILNSLADDKLQASVRCLASNGKFLEIGKFDASRNHSLGMECFLKNIEFHGIDFEKLLLGEHDKEVVLRHVEQGISAGVVKPLARTVFSKDQVEDAFRYMMSGKHIGKVVIQVREENSKIPENTTNSQSPPLISNTEFQAIIRTYCSPTKSYLIVGGLGGFGLELANWLVDRGAQHLILTSRSGVKTGYQNLCLQKWTGKNVLVETPIVDLANLDTAKEFIRDLYNNGRCLGGIFNSGLVLKDGLLKDQTAEGFELVGMPKIKITQNLDRISREGAVPSDLDYFVVFSSVASGLGNPGQSNYGYANAIMENICEARRADGLPALAIQWGIIGDVGYVAERMMVKQKKVGGGLEPSSILGLIPQRISSCLESLDATLGISKDFPNSLSPVSSCCFSSMLIADKVMDHSSMFKKLGLTAAVARICGVQDVNKINPATPLVELGVDSLSGIELKQLFERDYSLELSPKQIRGLKFGDLKMIEMGTFNPGNNLADVDTDKVEGNGSTTDDRDDYMGYILNSFRENAKESLIKLNAGNCDQHQNHDALPLFIVHGGDGLSAPFIPMASKVEFDLYCFQLISRGDSDNELSVRRTVEDFATEYIQELKQVQPEGPYNISGYSSGGTIAFEMATQLERLGDRVENLIIFDGFCSSEYVAMEHSIGILVTEALAIVKKVVDITENEEKEVVEKFSETPDDLEASKKVLMEFIESKLSTKDKDVTSPSYPRGRGIRNYFDRMISFATMSSLYRPSGNFQGKCHLIKAAVLSSGMDGFRDDTCHLKQYCDQPVIVNIVRGDHHNFLSAVNIEETTTILNRIWNTRRQDLQDECVLETEAIRDANKMNLPN